MTQLITCRRPIWGGRGAGVHVCSVTGDTTNHMGRRPIWGGRGAGVLSGTDKRKNDVYMQASHLGWTRRHQPTTTYYKKVSAPRPESALPAQPQRTVGCETLSDARHDDDERPRVDRKKKDRDHTKKCPRMDRNS